MNVQELYEDPALEGALGGVEPFAKAHGPSLQTSRKGTAVRAQLHPAQTQTKMISYPSNDGVWAR